jgi:hypothetical protein
MDDALKRLLPAWISVSALTNFSVDVAQQGHEAEIHVQLLMAVEQCEAWIVGDEIYFDHAAMRDYYYVFEYSCCALACKLR